MPDGMEEQALIRMAKGGDLDAFGALLGIHQPDAQRLAYLITGQTGDAEDAVQEGFVKAWQALARFDANRPFRPWLLKIVANEARTRRRVAGQRQRLQLRLAEAVGGEESGDPSPETTVLDRQLMQRLLYEIEQLPEADEIVLKLRYFFDLSTTEIAAMLDEPDGTIRSRLSRATRKLRERVTDEGETDFTESATWRRPANDRESV